MAHYKKGVAAMKCRVCGKEQANDQFYKRSSVKGLDTRCKTCRKLDQRQIRAERAASGLCIECGRKTDGEHAQCACCLDKIRKRKAKRKERDPQYAEQQRKAKAQNHLECKIRVFEAYGGAVCACCGERHHEFLSIDHIDGTGPEHRKQMNGSRRNGANLYRWLERNGFPPGYRVLCMNCNFALGHFGYCPHGNL